MAVHDLRVSELQSLDICMSAPSDNISRSDCNETCFAGKQECVAAGEDDGAREAWRCINCLDCDQDFPTSCDAHGDKHVAFKCFFCCNIATFFCGGKTHFCEQCHKQGWNAVPMKQGECRPGCNGKHPDHGSKKVHCLGCIVCRSLGLNVSTKRAQSQQVLAVVKVKKGLPVTAGEAALAAEQLELDRLEAERVMAAKRIADVQRLIDMNMSKSDAEALLDAHNGSADAAVSERRQQQKREEEQRQREAARDAAVQSLRVMGFENSLEEFHSLLSLKNNNVEQVVDVLLERQREILEKQSKREALAALGWGEAHAQDALERNAWNQDAAELALKKEKHAALKQHSEQFGCRNRLAKILRKRHSACDAVKGSPCLCKAVEAPRSAAPAQDAALEQQPHAEDFSGAFAMASRAEAADESFGGLFADGDVPSASGDAAADAQDESKKDDEEGFIVVKAHRERRRWRLWSCVEENEPAASASNESALNA